MPAKQKHERSKKGFVTLYAILLASVIIMIGLAVLDLTRSQLIITGTEQGSAAAFSAADSSLECVLYWDIAYDDLINANGGNIICPNAAPSSLTTSKPATPSTWTYSMEINMSDGTCADVTVLKDIDASGKVTKTTVSSNGYNTTCPAAGTVPRRLERGLRVIYGF